ncbi:MAG TPA: MFS transporter [Streptosporangiaceae bacterium]|jgi:EmrB/QacA subfamily drug resistance transporter|nr:MFS transporter [Streptosporangiaceae bacterium]
MATSQAAVANGDHATQADTGQAGYPRRWLAAIVLIVGALMDMIDVTIVNVALPSIRRDLHASATQLEWVVSGYMLAFAATLIIAGNLGDKFGRKRLFLSGAALFGLASLAAGLSGSGAELIIARIVQGVAAAAMAPQVLATFRVIFGRAERGKAFGIYGAMLGFASAIGLVLGGLLTGANLFGWEWRSVFYVNVPVAVAALIAGARFVPETKDPGARRPFVAGAVLLAGSLVAIVYPLLEGRQLGWPAWVWPLMAAGVAGLVVLGLIEARRTSTTVAPLLRAGLFRVPAFAAGMGVQLAFFAGMQGFFIAFALWLQAGEHFSPLKAGLTAVAFSVGSFIAAPVAVPLAQKAGRRILAGGAVLMVAGIGGVALAAPHVGVNGSPWPIVPGLVVAGAGLALLVIPLVNVVLAAVPAEVAGGASGLFSTAQQLGGALGVALLGSVFFGYLNGHSFEAALVHTAPYAMGAFALCGALALLLPRTAVSEEALTES